MSVLSTETLEPLIVQDGLDSVQGAYQSKAIFSRLVLVPNQASRLKGRCHEIVDPFLGKKTQPRPHINRQKRFINFVFTKIFSKNMCEILKASH